VQEMALVQDAATAAHGRQAMPTVLLVEDDPAIALLVLGLLSDAGYRPVTIADHGEIKGAIDRWRPECVLIDGALLPNGQGRSWSDAIAIRRADPDLPVLMFTADRAAMAEARAGTSDRSRAAGFAGVIGKPFVAEEFLAAVRSAVAAWQPPHAPVVAPVDDHTTAVTLPQDAAQWPAEGPHSAFLSMVVHELRTPLTVISGQVQLARRNILRDPEQERVALDRALVQVARMDRLIAELLGRSRLDTGAFALEVVAFDLCAVVADVVAQHRRDDGPQLVFEPATPHLRVRGDPSRIAQIVGNLVSNALKYGSGSRVDISLGGVRAEALVLVEDHGVGIPADEQGRLFEPYYRSSRTRAVPGTGLGLHISRRLAERHGGRLWLERSTEAGSVFALALPVAAG